MKRGPRFRRPITTSAHDRVIEDLDTTQVGVGASPSPSRRATSLIRAKRPSTGLSPRPEMGINVQLELPDPEMESLHVLCGPAESQVLTNLSSTPSATVEGGESTLRLEAEGETVRITVEDAALASPKKTSTALPRALLPRGQSRSRHAGGSGLGLAIVTSSKHLPVRSSAIHLEQGNGLFVRTRQPRCRG